MTLEKIMWREDMVTMRVDAIAEITREHAPAKIMRGDAVATIESI